MELRTARFYSACNRPDLMAGCDRKLFVLVVTLVGCMFFMTPKMITAIAGVVLFVIAYSVLRKLAKADPLLVPVYQRHITYKRVYAPQATPWRENTPGDKVRWNGSMSDSIKDNV